MGQAFNEQTLRELIAEVDEDGMGFLFVICFSEITMVKVVKSQGLGNQSFYTAQISLVTYLISQQRETFVHEEINFKKL